MIGLFTTLNSSMVPSGMGRDSLIDEFFASEANPRGALDNQFSRACTSKLNVLNCDTSMVGASDLRPVCLDQNESWAKDESEVKHAAKRTTMRTGEVRVQFITTVFSSIQQFNQ